MTDHVCHICKDTHVMPFHGESGERLVPCTYCPTPCQKCRKGGFGAYCEHTPCDCDCHKDLKGYEERKAEAERSQPDRVEVADDSGNKATDHLYPKKDDRRVHPVTGELARSDMMHPATEQPTHTLTLTSNRSEVRDRLLLELSQAVLTIMTREKYSVEQRQGLGGAIIVFQALMGP